MSYAPVLRAVSVILSIHYAVLIEINELEMHGRMN